MVKKYVGGVKQVNPSVSSFTSVMSFLQKSTVSSISYSSRFGFIFKAELKPGLESDFLELNDSKKEFDKPVTTLVFKIAMLMQKENYDKINGAYKTVENELANKSVITEKLSNKVETYQKSMDQMKENYDKLNGALEEANGKLSKLSNIKNNKKKLTPTNSEWTDGNQV